MFFVFGTAGQVQVNNLERRMAEIAGVHRTARVRPFRAAEGEPDTEPVAARTSSSGREALAAYAQAGTPPARQPLTLVAQVMSSEVVRIAQDAPVAEGWALLARHRLAQAPVIDAQGVLVGLLLRADLLQPALLPTTGAERAAWQQLAQGPVHACMHTPVPAVAPDTDVRRVARVLLDTGLPGLPVTDAQGQVVGFVSRTDLLRAMVANPPLDLWS